MKRLTTSILALGLLGWLQAAPPAAAAGVETPILKSHWHHDGIFGTFDRAAVQRGLQVYLGVCSACHAAKYFKFRNLAALGYGEDDIKAIAAQFEVTDGPNDAGEMFQRPGRPSDGKPAPFPNEQAARAANGGAYPLDLSLIAKARGGGTDYLYSLLVGYEEPPAGVDVPPGMYYNKHFPGHLIAMPAILQDDAVTYADGVKATKVQMAQDVAQYLTWLAEPKMEARKQTGVKVMLFLVILTGLLYAYKRRVWADVH